MNSEEAKKIAEKYGLSEVNMLTLAIDILAISANEYEKGWKDCNAEWEACWERITEGRERKN